MALSFPSNPPPDPGFSQAQIQVRSAVAVSEGFNFADRRYGYGASKWMGNLKVNSIEQDQARAWKAWIASMSGKRGTFKLSDPGYFGPYGDVSQQGTVNSYTSTYFLNCTGYSADTEIFKKGDQIEVNDELKIILRDVTSDSNGRASIPIMPTFHADPSNGDTVKHTEPKGTFRLGENLTRWTDETVVTDLDFPIMEATNHG